MEGAFDHVVPFAINCVPQLMHGPVSRGRVWNRSYCNLKWVHTCVSQVQSGCPGYCVASAYRSAAK